MEFNPDNKIIKLCASGMELEGEGQLEEAANLFKIFSRIMNMAE